MTRSDSAAPLRLGLIGRAHGLGGAFRVVGAAGVVHVRARRDAAARRRSRAPLLAVAGTQQSPILQLEGLDSREDAAAVLGHTLELRASDAPAPEEDAFWVRDLVGMRARCGERELGEVTDVLERPANDVLVLRLRDGREHLRPVHARGRAGRGRARAASWSWPRHSPSRSASRDPCSRSTSSRSSRTGSPGSPRSRRCSTRSTGR